MDRDWGSVWVATCIDGGDVVFPRIVQEGDQVYYDPYYIDNDTTTLYGYVHSVEEVVR